MNRTSGEKRITAKGFSARLCFCGGGGQEGGAALSPHLRVYVGLEECLRLAVNEDMAFLNLPTACQDLHLLFPPPKHWGDLVLSGVADRAKEK